MGDDGDPERLHRDRRPQVGLVAQHHVGPEVLEHARHGARHAPRPPVGEVVDELLLGGLGAGGLERGQVARSGHARMVRRVARRPGAEPLGLDPGDQPARAGDRHLVPGGPRRPGQREERREVARPPTKVHRIRMVGPDYGRCFRTDVGPAGHTGVMRARERVSDGRSGGAGAPPVLRRRHAGARRHARGPPDPAEEMRIVLERHAEEGIETFALERRLAYRDRHLGELLVPADAASAPT